MTITPEYVANWIRKQFAKEHPYCDAGLKVKPSGETSVMILQHNTEDAIKVTVERSEIE